MSDIPVEVVLMNMLVKNETVNIEQIKALCARFQEPGVSIDISGDAINQAIIKNPGMFDWLGTFTVQRVMEDIHPSFVDDEYNWRVSEGVRTKFVQNFQVKL